MTSQGLFERIDATIMSIEPQGGLLRREGLSSQGYEVIISAAGLTQDFCENLHDGVFLNCLVSEAAEAVTV